MVASDVLGPIRPGAGLVVATAGPDGPLVERAWAVTVVGADPLRLRVVVGADVAAFVEHLPLGRAALTGADVQTYASVQLKGPVRVVEAPTEGDLAAFAEQSTAFLEQVHAVDGNPMGLLQRLLPAEVVAFELDVDEVYDQTPGPGAGAVLPAAR